MSKSVSGVTAPNVTKFQHDVATLSALPSCSLAFRCTSSFRNGKDLVAFSRSAHQRQLRSSAVVRRTRT